MDKIDVSGFTSAQQQQVILAFEKVIYTMQVQITNLQQRVTKAEQQNNAAMVNYPFVQVQSGVGPETVGGIQGAHAPAQSQSTEPD